MPPTKDHSAKYSYGRSVSHSETTMSAKVYHPATNLMPPTPPHSPTGMAPSFLGSKNSSTSASWSRQNSYNGGKYM